MPRKCAMEIWSDQSTKEFLHLLFDFTSQNAGQAPKANIFTMDWLLNAKCGQFFYLKQMRSK